MMAELHRSDASPCSINSRQPLHISHSPDPDDAFAWWALRLGRVPLPAAGGVRWSSLTVQQSNLGCIDGTLDIAAISAAAYPLIARDYAILASGASVGRGYGPALATRDLSDPPELADRTVAIPGGLTTGALLLRLLYPSARVMELACDEIAPALVAGRVAAGVLIHEELMNWQDRGLRRLACLGAAWTAETGLPIPVGLVVAKRSLGDELLRRLSATLRESVLCGLAHRAEAMSWALTYSCESSPGIAERFVDMFTNDDTLDLPQDARAALALLYRRASERRLIPAMPRIDLVPTAPIREVA